MSNRFDASDPSMPTSDYLMINGESSGSFDDFRVSNQEVDDLLAALEVSTNEQDFLKSDDDELVKTMLGIERLGGVQNLSFTQAPTHGFEFSLIDQASLPSIDGIDPLGLDDLPSDPNLLADVAEGFYFQSNDPIEAEEEDKVYHAMATTGGVASDDTAASSMVGKRRRVPRRGSLPTMHLHYEDPFEPTPIIEHETMFEQQQHEEEPPPKLAAVPGGEMTNSDTPPGGRRRAQRRGSLPTMHLNYESTFSTSTTHDSVDYQYTWHQQLDHEGANSINNVNNEYETIRRVGRMERRGSTGSFYAGHSTSAFIPSSAVGVGDIATTVPSSLDPEKMMKRLQELMAKSCSTQSQLQQWDKANGLPKSHSQTMVNTSRSRKQLLDGVILPKWDGTPLISGDTELGKPKPRSKAHKKDFGGKMKRRMSAPVSSAFF